MKVEKTKSTWPEQKKRIRRWFPMDKGIKKAGIKGLRKLLKESYWEILRKEKLMKEFFLIRHGKSSHSAEFLTDFDRILNTRGRKDSADMGQRLLNNKIMPDLIISSTAVRASETATLIANELSYPLENIKYEDDLYLCGVGNFRKVLTALDDKYQRVFLIAHNPTITDAETYFSDIRRDNIPTCGICGFEIFSWKEIKGKSCREIYYDYPKNVLH